MLQKPMNALTLVGGQSSALFAWEMECSTKENRAGLVTALHRATPLAHQDRSVHGADPVQPRARQEDCFLDQALLDDASMVATAATMSDLPAHRQQRPAPQPLAQVVPPNVELAWHQRLLFSRDRERRRCLTDPLVMMNLREELPVSSPIAIPNTQQHSRLYARAESTTCCSASLGHKKRSMWNTRHQERQFQQQQEESPQDEWGVFTMEHDDIGYQFSMETPSPSLISGGGYGREGCSVCNKDITSKTQYREQDPDKERDENHDEPEMVMFEMDTESSELADFIDENSVLNRQLEATKNGHDHYHHHQQYHALSESFVPPHELIDRGCFSLGLQSELKRRCPVGI